MNEKGKNSENRFAMGMTGSVAQWGGRALESQAALFCAVSVGTLTMSEIKAIASHERFVAVACPFPQVQRSSQRLFKVLGLCRQHELHCLAGL